MRGIGSHDSRFREQFEGNAADDNSLVGDVGNAVEIRQADASNNAAGEWGLFDEERLGPLSRRGQCRGSTGTTTAADEDVGGDGFALASNKSFTMPVIGRT